MTVWRREKASEEILVVNTVLLSSLPLQCGRLLLERGIKKVYYHFAVINWMEECVFGEGKR